MEWNVSNVCPILPCGWQNCFFPFSYNVFKLKSRSGGSERKLSPVCCSSLSVLFFPFFFTSRLALLIDFSCCPLGHDFCEKRQKLASSSSSIRARTKFLVTAAGVKSEEGSLSH